MVDRHLIDVHVLLTGDDGLLLTRRRSSDAYSGYWHLPSGKVERGESITAAAAREALEEVAVTIEPSDLRLVHVAHVADAGPEPRLGLFLHATRWHGDPGNNEPEKCYAVQWFPTERLPDNMIGYTAIGIRAFLTGQPEPLTECGWTATE